MSTTKDIREVVEDELIFDAPCRDLKGKTFPDETALRAAYAATPVGRLQVKIVR